MSTVATLGILSAVGASVLMAQASPTSTDESAPLTPPLALAAPFDKAGESLPDGPETDPETLEPPATLVETEPPPVSFEPQVRTSEADLHPALTASGQAALSRHQIRHKGRLYGVNITFYDCKGQGFCGGMYNGRKVYQGAAACSWNLPLGTRFNIVGDPTKRTYTCEDRGLLDETWVDVFWNEPRDGWIWQSKVGRYASIEVISLP